MSDLAALRAAEAEIGATWTRVQAAAENILTREGLHPLLPAPEWRELHFPGEET